MHAIDWAVLLATLGFIVGYGVWRTRRTHTVERYLRGDNEDRWWAVTLSVMATQASAITFLSTPGQGFLEGMGFVQFYFGLPLAMVVIACNIVSPGATDQICPPLFVRIVPIAFIVVPSRPVTTTV